jgi:hypothetical protein
MPIADDVADHDRAAYDDMLWPLALVTCGFVVAYAVALVEVVSVLVSGPLLCVVGVWLAWRATLARSWAGVFLGSGVVVLVASLFGAVNALGWSPADAEAPFAQIGAVTGSLFVGLALVALAGPRRPPAALSGLWSHQAARPPQP